MTVDLNWHSRIAQSKNLMKLVVSVWLFSLTFHLNDMFKLSVVRHFFQLRQLRNVRHSVDNETAATLIHAFVSSRLDLLSSTDTVTVCYLEHQRSWLMSCRMFRMLLRDFCLVTVVKVVCKKPCMRNFTGWQSLTGSTISYVYLFTRLCMVRRRSIYKNCASRHQVTYIERVWDQHIYETHYLRNSRTPVFR